MCIFNKEDPQVVLASWLFMQFMLTNDVQIAYSQTEGYIPVTSKAHNSLEYTEYLAKAGTDGDLHYKIKLDATNLLLDNIDNTFVTPVFNGSASLRNAAGQMIEEVTKAVRRNKIVDEAFIEDLYEEMISLYKLDEINKDPSKMAKLGPLPKESIALITLLSASWISLGTIFTIEMVKKRKAQ
jgi:multiple sugar transport system substrate-binding protein